MVVGTRVTDRLEKGGALVSRRPQDPEGSQEMTGLLGGEGSSDLPMFSKGMTIL